MKQRIISNTSYEVLKNSGSVVPRNEGNYIIDTFAVGKEYKVISKDNNEPIKVRCTQNCPHHLVVI